MMIISILRYYHANIQKVDQDSIELLNQTLYLLTNPNIFLNERISWLYESSNELIDSSQ
jgi:hypothetical protein